MPLDVSSAPARACAVLHCAHWGIAFPQRSLIRVRVGPALRPSEMNGWSCARRRSRLETSKRHPARAAKVENISPIATPTRGPRPVLGGEDAVRRCWIGTSASGATSMKAAELGSLDGHNICLCVAIKLTGVIGWPRTNLRCAIAHWESRDSGVIAAPMTRE